ncbi:MAG: metallopeptidase family protein [Chloroflexi bacterium]|nr:metallopeptidase family protein [Chloroflexota bacterium]
MARLSRGAFDRIVAQAVEGLPPEIRQRLENVAVVVKAWPARDDLAEAGAQDPYELFGLYQGVPLTERGQYGPVVPDKITIFQRPLEAACASRGALLEQIRATVLHEVAHHFGLEHEQLEGTPYA